MKVATITKQLSSMLLISAKPKEKKFGESPGAEKMSLGI
jgi:hypothetical protein